jgi:adenine/guanine phosphoribosyltransferase-like PRPP-binding protein
MPAEHLPQACLCLADAAGDGGRIDAVVGVLNGGRTPATAIAAHLGVPRWFVRARHNATDAVYTQATGWVSCEADGTVTSLRGRVLVVDDICGTGATLTAVRGVLAGPDVELVTCALCVNAGAADRPDLWVWDVRDWVVFPWESAPPAGQPSMDLPVPGQARRR